MGFPVRLDNRFMWVAWLSFLPLVRKRGEKIPIYIIVFTDIFLV